MPREKIFGSIKKGQKSRMREWLTPWYKRKQSYELENASPENQVTGVESYSIITPLATVVPPSSDTQKESQSSNNSGMVKLSNF